MAENILDMQSICEGISSLANLAIAQYTPLVEEMYNSDCIEFGK